MHTIGEILARLERTADRIDELLELARERDRELRDCDCIFCIPTFDLSLAGDTLIPTGAILPDDPPGADAPESTFSPRDQA